MIFFFFYIFFSWENLGETANAGNNDSTKSDVSTTTLADIDHWGQCTFGPKDRSTLKCLGKTFSCA